jgi:predicted phage tail protein
MKLVEKFYTKWSVQLTSLCLALAALEPFLPELQQALPGDWYRYAFAAILVARVIKQTKPAV